MAGSASNPVRLDPWQNIIEVGWKKKIIDVGMGIIDAWLDPAGAVLQKWSFEAQLQVPGADRYPVDGLGHGDYIVGEYQTGLSGGSPGDYGYSAANRTDPPNGGHVTAGPLLLPGPGEMTNRCLWHVGTCVAGQYETLIVNIKKILTDFPGSSVEYDALIIQIAGLGSGTGWRFRAYEPEKEGDPPGTFSFEDVAAGIVQFSTPLAAINSGSLNNAIVNSANIDWPF